MVEAVLAATGVGADDEGVAGATEGAAEGVDEGVDEGEDEGEDEAEAAQVRWSLLHRST